MTLALSFCAAAIACSGNGGDTGDGTDESSSAGTTMTSPSTTEDGSTDETVTVTTVTATEESSGDATTDPDTSSGSTDTGTENLCMPDADDDECYVCGKEMCCAQFMACAEADSDCACVLECLAALDTPGPMESMTCSDDCGADFISLITPLMNITACQQKSCGDVC